MVQIPEPVLRLLRHRDSTKVLATVDPEGRPHMIVCGTLIDLDEENIGLGDVFMKRSAENLESNPKVEFILRLGPDAYSIKAECTGYVEHGTDLLRVNSELSRANMTAKRLWTFKIEEIWNESATKYSGTQMA